MSCARGKYFNREFMEQFNSELGEIKAPVGGAPDDGNGKFSDRLDYKDWVTFNVFQRIHKNFYETFTVVTVVGAIGCLVFPWVTIYVFPIWMFGRLCYGPSIFSGKLPIICINMCCFVMLPFWALYGGGVGFILQGVDINYWQKDDMDLNIKVARVIPFPSNVSSK